MGTRITVDFGVKGTADFSNIQSEIKRMGDSFKNLKLPTNIGNDLKKKFGDLDEAVKSYQERLAGGFKTKGDLTKLERDGQKINRMFDSLTKDIEKIFSGFDTKKLQEVFDIDLKPLEKAKNDLEELKSKISKGLSIPLEIKTKKGDNVETIKTSVEEQLKGLRKLSKGKPVLELENLLSLGDIEGAKQKLAELPEYIEKNFQKINSKTGEPNKNYERMLDIVQKLGLVLDATGANGEKSLSALSAEAINTAKEIRGMEEAAEKAANVKVSELTKDVRNVGAAAKESTENLEGAAKESQNLNSQLEQMKSRAEHFFGIAGAARLARQAIRQLWQETQELDKSMTETAVVTDYSVSDMWKKLPQYTKFAKELGVATKELYDATTLYYQQGLKGNEVMNIGVETLKLARISGLEAAQATDLMTTALRGFNMEINETSAKNISDTYAALAASSASNVQELATAMSKTASLAASVGADFKNIAVFLAQGIETTRESADTVGTALKTVLARFNELKKDPAEIMDVDGEVVDANKVEAALRSVGIALRDTNGQFRNADEVLLEVSQKWNTMSIMQQRYIATQAAGSRQQSRFIAMMSDYNRTLELQQIALNANGAANKQFEKTQESLQTKLQRLKDTWQQFILGLANDKFIKGLIDTLNLLLNTVNKLTNLPGIFGSISKALASFMVFKGSKKVIDGFSKAVAAAKESGGKAGTAFVDSLGKSLKASGKSIGSHIRNIFKKETWVGSVKQDLEKAKNELTTSFNKMGTSIEASMNGIQSRINTIEASGRPVISLQQEWNKLQLESTRISELEALAQTANTDQVALYNAAVANGMSIDQAKLALTAANIESFYAQAVAELVAAGATEEEAKAKMLLIKASFEELTTARMGILTKIKAIATALFGAKASKADAIAKLEEAGATTIAAVAQKLLNKEIMGFPAAWFLVVIAAIAAALVGLGFLIADIVKKNSIDYKLEQAKEATETATKAAEKAKEAYSDLLEGHNKYNELTETLKELNKGTDEWTQTLLEANQQVLELLDKYPKLAQYVSTDENGRLAISDEGWKVVTEETRSNMVSAQAAQAATKTRELNLAREAARESAIDAIDDHGDGHVGQIYGEQILNYLKTHHDFKENLNYLTNEYGLSIQQVKDIIKDYQNYAQTTQGFEFQKEAAQTGVRALVSSDLQGLGADSATAEALSRFINETVSDSEVDKIADSLRAGTGSNSGAADKLRELGYGDLETGNQKKDMAQLYGVLYNMTYEEVLDLFGADDSSDIDNEKISKAIATKLASGEQTKNVTEFYKTYYSKLSEKSQKAVGRFFSKDGAKLLVKDLNTKDWQKELENLARESGLTTEEFAKSLNFSSWQGLLNDVSKQINIASQDKEEIERKLRALGEFNITDENGNTETQNFADQFQKSKITQNLTSEEYNNLGKHFYDVMIKSGPEAAAQIMGQIEDLFSGLPDGVKDTFIGQLSMLNWNDTEEIQKFRQQLLDLGIDIEKVNLNPLLKDIADFSKAVSNLSFEQITEKIKQAQSTINDLYERDYNDYTFDEDEMKALIDQNAANSDDFVQYGNQWYYLNGSINDLIKALDDNTLALQGDKKKELKEKVDDLNYIENSIVKENLDIITTKYDDALDNAQLTNDNLSGLTIKGEVNGASYQIKDVSELLSNQKVRQLILDSQDNPHLITNLDQSNGLSKDILSFLKQYITLPKDGSLTLAAAFENSVSQLFPYIEQIDSTANQIEYLKSFSSPSDWYKKQQEDSLIELSELTFNSSGSYNTALNLLKNILGESVTQGIGDFTELEINELLASSTSSGFEGIIEQLTNYIIDIYTNKTKYQEELGSIPKTYVNETSSVAYAAIERGLVGGDIDEVNAGTDALLTQGLATGKLTQYVQNLKDAKEAYNKTQNKVTRDNLRNAANILQQKIAYQGLTNSIQKANEKAKDYVETLKDSNATDEEKANAVAEIRSILERYLNIDLDPEYIAGHVEEIEKILTKPIEDKNGGFIDWLNHLDEKANTAFSGMSDAVKEVLDENEKVFSNFSGTVNDFITGLNNSTFEIDGTISGDSTRFVQAMVNAMAAAGMAEEDIVKALKKMSGYGVEWTLEKTGVSVDELMAAQVEFSKAMASGNSTRIAAARSNLKKLEENNGGYKVSGVLTTSGTDLTDGADTRDTSNKGGGSNKDTNTYEPDVDPLYNEKQKLKAIQNDQTKAENEYNKELKKEIPNIGKLVSYYEQLTASKEQELEQNKKLRDMTAQEISDLENEKLNADLFKYAHFDAETGTVWQDVDAIAALKGSDEDFGKRLDDYIKKLEELADQYVEYDQAVGTVEEELAERNKRTDTVFEKHLNELAKLAELERQSNRLQEQYNNLLDRQVVLGRDLYKKQQEQLVVLEDIVKDRKNVLDLQKKDAQETWEKLVAEGYGEYMNYDPITNQLVSFEAVILEKEDAIQEEIKTKFDLMQEAVNQVTESEDSVFEAEQNLSKHVVDIRKKALEGIAKIREIVVAKYQEMIDSLSTINDSINDSNSKLIDNIQKNISQMRQDRENEKTEKDLQDKEAQLAYLMQDTTGANLQKIKELQEQLDEGKKTYTDTLIDQKISELQEQNDEAAEQRQEQIDIMTEWLDLYQKSGLINEEIDELIKSGLDENGEVIAGSLLEQMITKYGVTQGLTEQELQEELKPIYDELVSIKNIYGGSLNGVGPLEDFDVKTKDARQAARIATHLESANELSEMEFDKLDVNKDGKITAEDARYLMQIAAKLITRSDVPKKFATGGLADYTGPAWLDGTPSNPELVLNAQDTQNFITLKDILAGLLNSTNGITAANGGDNYFDIHIEVEKVENDYDVDQMADRIKNLIRDEAMYRNVNIINQW